MREMGPTAPVFLFGIDALEPVFHLPAESWKTTVEHERVGLVPVAHCSMASVTLCGVEIRRLSWSIREDTCDESAFNCHRDEWVKATLQYRHATSFGRLCHRCEKALVVEGEPVRPA